MTKFRWAITGVTAAIVITTAMDAAGLSAFSALPLLPLALILWSVERLPRRDVGLTLGRVRHYGLALLHPLLVIGVLTGLAAAFGRMHIADTSWTRAATRIVIASTAGALAVLLTEEGFFRGWLWASLRRAGLTENHVLLWSSIAFAAWHISAVTLETGFNPPPAQVPTFLVNALLMGMIWGLLRSISGSVVVAAVCHAVWNAVAYSLYGFGTKPGALGITDTFLFAPETGVIGLVLNILFALWLWRSRSAAACRRS
jgi:uncharacterized protein